MANPDSVKPRKEDANMAMNVGFRTDQDQPSDTEGISAEERLQLVSKNSKVKKSCFQITSVKETPQNDDNDSIDDMDESRAEDFSSSELLDVSKSSTVTEIDRHGVGENTHSTPKKVTNNVGPPTNNSSIVNVNVNQAIPNQGLGRRTGSEPPHELLHQVSDPGKPTNGNQQGNGNPASRFKVVKVPRIEPFTRGRWTCRDFEMQQSSQTSADNVNKTEQQNKDLRSGDSSAASSVHGDNSNADNPIGGDTTTTGTSEQSGNKNSKSNTGRRLKSHLSDSSIGGVELDHHGGTLEDTIKETFDGEPSAQSEDTNLSEDGLEAGIAGQRPLRAPSPLSYHARFYNRRVQPRVPLGARRVDSTLSTSAGGAIDNKIEQAMDLVKSHLLYAVREEVEVLKVQIKELAEKNEQLQRENAMLRQAGPAPQTDWSASAAPGAPMAMPQQTLPQQGIAPQQPPYSAAGNPQGQTLPPQQGQLPMGMQSLPQQPTAPHPQAMPQQQAAVSQLPQSAPQQNPEQQQYAHLQQQAAIPMQAAQQQQQQQQQHSIPGKQQAGAQPPLQTGQPLTTLPNQQAVQLSQQAQQPSQAPKT